MKTQPACLPCFLRQASAVARLAGTDHETHEQMIRATLRLLAEADYEVPPPKIAHDMYPMLCRLVGTDDPYRETKERYDDIAAGFVHKLLPGLMKTDDPFRALLHLALAGNIIDFGISDQFDLEGTVERSLREAPDLDEVQRLQRAVEKARRILYLTDNTGEIVFDKAWIEHALPVERVTVAVRSGPIINDATRRDAERIGLADLVPIIDPGIAVPGTWLEGSSESFQKAFGEADLVISKGQGNFETLFERVQSPPVFFLFMVKCPVVSELVQLPQGARVAAFHDTLLQRGRNESGSASRSAR